MPLLSPQDICSRLEAFASRTDEVQNPEDRTAMEDAVAGFSQSVRVLVHGIDVLDLPEDSSGTLSENLANSIAALRGYGPVTLLHELETLEELNACLNEMFAGLEICRARANASPQCDDGPSSSVRRSTSEG